MGLIEKLKEARIRAGLRQSDVEDRTGITAKTISNWENKVSKPDVDSVAILLRLYNMDPNTAFEWESEQSDSGGPETWTKEEAEEIENYKEFLRTKRNK